MRTEELMVEWINARRHSETQRELLKRSEEIAKNATNELGEWLIPKGVKDMPEESDWDWFNVWIGFGVLRARRLSSGDYQVEWLKEPDGKDRLRFNL